MILDLLPTNEKNLYEGVPANRVDAIDVRVTKPSILVARIVQNVPESVRQVPADIRKCLDKYGKGVAAIVLMTNDGSEAWKNLESFGLPLIIGQQLRLPGGTNYTGSIGIADRTSIWGESQIITREGSNFLTPQYVQYQAPYKITLPLDISLAEIGHNVEVRRVILGNLGMPRNIRITEGHILINSK